MKGTIEAQTRDQAIERIKKIGLYPTELVTQLPAPVSTRKSTSRRSRNIQAKKTSP